MKTLNLEVKHSAGTAPGNHPHGVGRIASTCTRTVAIATSVLFLHGCLLTSPYWNQEFSDHTAAVPLQAWTTDKTKTVKFECAKAFHGGLYPSAGAATWITIDNINPQQNGLRDSYKALVYGAGKTSALPSGCWRQDPGNSIYYAAVRASHMGSSKVEYHTFTKTGLECLGRENGKAASWFGWLNKGCQSAPKYVIFRATS